MSQNLACSSNLKVQYPAHFPYFLPIREIFLLLEVHPSHELWLPQAGSKTQALLLSKLSNIITRIQ